MLELNNHIARLEISSEQLRIHLRTVAKNSLEAEAVRTELLIVLQTLAALKGQRQKLQSALRREEMASSASRALQP